jgi:hypothetical protein
MLDHLVSSPRMIPALFKRRELQSYIPIAGRGPLRHHSMFMTMALLIRKASKWKRRVASLHVGGMLIGERGWTWSDGRVSSWPKVARSRLRHASVSRSATDLSRFPSHVQQPPPVASCLNVIYGVVFPTRHDFVYSSELHQSVVSWRASDDLVLHNDVITLCRFHRDQKVNSWIESIK